MTGGVLALTLLAASAVPASAEFRYVPPVVAESPAEPAAKGTGALHGEIEPRPGPGRAVSSASGTGASVSGASVSGTSVSGTSVSGTSVSGTSIWRVHAGETLRGVLARWGARAGAEVLFLTDRRYRLEGEAAFQGGFADAVRALFEAISHLPHPPEGAFSTDRRSLAVTHRQAVPTETGCKP